MLTLLEKSRMRIIGLKRVKSVTCDGKDNFRRLRDGRELPFPNSPDTREGSSFKFGRMLTGRLIMVRSFHEPEGGGIAARYARTRLSRLRFSRG